MEIIPQLLLVLLLVFLNGYFVASEFALVAVRKTRIEELVRKKNRAAKLVQSALADLDSYISATQLGITIASLALGWIGEPALARLIEPHFGFLPNGVAFFSSHTIAIIIAFSIITFLHIVLGELAPKSIALQRSEITSLFIIAPLIAFTKVFKPIIWVLNGAGNLILKVFRISPLSGHQLVHSEEEIKMILNQSGLEGAIEEEEVEMVYNVFKLGDMPIKQIMIPRTDIVAFNVNTALKDVLKKVMSNVHSRFPVYENAIDNVVGFIHIKDIYKAAMKTDQNARLSEMNIIRKIISVPENKRADEVLLDMRKKRIHIAVVNDEYGGTAGLVTLEDIIESLVGEIHDEFEKPVKEIQRQKDGSYLIDGLLPIEKVQKRFSLPLRGQGYSTIGGLVFGLLGREPVVGDEVQIGTISFTVEAFDKKRIKLLRMRRVKKEKKK
ncbi:MAG: HlyC/CorC family transporter [Candidatus Levybacteria bacterium]|nr:HlyC/CorC family transporter [Candidatus Levybacteria bacterium]